MNKYFVYLIQSFGSVLCGFAFGTLLLFILGRLAPQENFMPVAYALMGFFIGYPLGVFGGIILTGRILKSKGSWWNALVGVVAMFLLSVALLEPLHINQSGFWLVIFLIILPVVSGLICFYFNDLKK